VIKFTNNSPAEGVVCRPPSSFSGTAGASFSLVMVALCELGKIKERERERNKKWR